MLAFLETIKKIIKGDKNSIDSWLFSFYYKVFYEMMLLFPLLPMGVLTPRSNWLPSEIFKKYLKFAPMAAHALRSNQSLSLVKLFAGKCWSTSYLLDVFNVYRNIWRKQDCLPVLCTTRNSEQRRIGTVLFECRPIYCDSNSQLH